MLLSEALQKAEFNGLTDQEALDYGNTLVVVGMDSTPYTWSGIGAKLIENGVAPADVVKMAAEISSLPGGPILDKCLTSGGFDFSSDLNRMTIQSFEVSEPDWAVTVLDAMLNIGRKQGTRWLLWGVSQPILADITSTRAALPSMIENNRIVAAWTVVSNALAAGQITTFSQAAALFGQQ